MKWLRSLDGYAAFGHGLGWSPDGLRLASTMPGHSIGIWELDGDDRPVTVFQGHASKPNCLAWSPDGSMLLSGDTDGKAIVWDAGSGEPIHELDGGSPKIWSVAWHPHDSTIAVGGTSPTLRFFDSTDGKLLQDIEAQIHRWTFDIAWSPDGSKLAAASQSEAVRVWDGAGGELLWSHTNVARYILGFAWSPSGDVLCAGHQEQSVFVFDGDSGDLRTQLEGYSAEVSSVSISADGRAIASRDKNGAVLLWEMDKWSLATVIAGTEEGGGIRPGDVAFNPTRPVLAVIDEGKLDLFEVDLDTAFGLDSAKEAVRFTSAKIVLVGESNVGKSCLAMRLAEDRYPSDEEQATTHGMRFWPMDAEALHETAATDDQRREVVLWDFGGQNEYRLVHQIFLHDTSLALVLFDPTRGAKALEEVVDWNARLDRQLGDGSAVKLLVGAKQDERSDLVDRQAIEKARAKCGFDAYVEVSARTGRNVDELREALAKALEWDSLVTATRPKLFQQVRDQIEARRVAGDVVVLVEDIASEMRQEDPVVDEDAIAAVARQLAIQGTIAQTNLTEGRHALLLQVPVIERYAGSLIVAARSNPRGVPAFEERLLGSPELPLPGIPADERLPRLDERILLECVAELMIGHGLCVRHGGLLIFPSLFPPDTEDEEAFEHSVSLYYDFTGPIDDIYASLVARLMVSGEFGEGRLYPRRAEFDQPGQGVCGVREVTRRGGLAHLDLFFSEGAGPERRELFARFVAEHLARNGVVIREHQAVICRKCKREIEEDMVQANISAGQKDVICPWCRETTLISEAVTSSRGRDSESEQRIVALHAEVERRTEADTQRAKAAVASGEDERVADEGPIRVLHLSDLHFTADTSPDAKTQQLLQDIRNGEGLGFDSVEYLVISGDFTDRGGNEGLEKARQFVAQVNEELSVSTERCVFVPGNHDVQDVEEAYQYFSSAERAREIEPDESRWHREGSVVFVPSARYRDRLRSFSESLFHKLTQRPYPLAPQDQGLSYLYPDTGIQFLALDSCWEIDHFHRKRASVHPDSVAHAIAAAEAQVAAAVEDGRLEAGAPVLKIGVWHHALQHPEMIREVDFVELLQQAGVRLALHGDVHEANRDRFRYWHREAMEVLGAGSFGSPADGRPESTPRLYNLLEIDRELGKIRVHTRCQKTANGAWSPWNEWPPPDGSPGALPFYDIEIPPH